MRASIVVLIAKDLWNKAARDVFSRLPRALVVSTKWLVYIRGTVARLQEAKYKIIGLFLFSSFAVLSRALRLTLLSARSPSASDGGWVPVKVG